MNTLYQSVLTIDSTSFVSDSKLLSSNNSMSLCQEHGFTPFPFNQCWNMERQHTSGSLGWVVLITSNLVPLSSNSSRSPIFCHFGTTVSIILILFPSLVCNIVSLLRVGVASICMINKIISNQIQCTNRYSLKMAYNPQQLVNIKFVQTKNFNV